MGEYINFMGQHLKIGTCEDLTDVTYEELKYMVEHGATKAPGGAEPKEYLTGDGWRYRFPFPSDNRSDLDKGVAVTVPVGWQMDGHERICLPLYARSGGYGINVFVPCPLGQDAKPEMFSAGPHARIVEIAQQRVVEGHLWTVVRCPYCQQKWRLTPEEAAQLVAHIRQDYSEKYTTSPAYWAEIADTIERGYRDPV